MGLPEESDSRVLNAGTDLIDESSEATCAVDVFVAGGGLEDQGSTDLVDEVIRFLKYWAENLGSSQTPLKFSQSLLCELLWMDLL
ncbi:hypothetical protein RHMOL_Rhmol04G0154800 [Rhododendron molle]|uniref:Uncharacterized protein n=1 Tax=Rhododendron molle TaxID=49168 RepID=A0ACC0P2K8_RHOML|nr:hypothetical protein RHMOL_Rhmol04G0154800 [Rhododendron molle]